MRYRFAVVTTKADQMNAAVLSIGLLALLEKIPDHASKEEVHRLRTTVRRLEVQLQNCPPKLAKMLKRLRTKAGRVRDIDVHLGLLKRPLAPRTRPEECQNQLREILKGKRDCHVSFLRDLAAESAPLLKAKLPALTEQSSEAAPTQQEAHHVAARSREQYLRWTRRIPEDPTRLHQLRINTKKMRYSLEPLVANEECAELAAKFKQVQDAIGNWHDWDTLKELAVREFGSSKAAPVCRLLEARAEREYRKARRVAQTVRTWVSGSKPVASAVGDESQKLTRKAA